MKKITLTSFNHLGSECSILSYEVEPSKEIGLLEVLRIPVENDTLLISRFEVEYEYRAQGIGKTLWKNLLDYFSKHSVKSIMVTPVPCDSAITEEELRTIYLRLGFEEIPDTKAMVYYLK